MSDPDIKARLEDLGRRTKELAVRMERLRAGHVSPETLRKYGEERRSHLWQMPMWLWLPIVSALVLLFLLGLYSAGR